MCQALKYEETCCLWNAIALQYFPNAISLKMDLDQSLDFVYIIKVLFRTASRSGLFWDSGGLSDSLNGSQRISKAVRGELECVSSIQEDYDLASQKLRLLINLW